MRLKSKDGKLVNTTKLSNPLFINHLTRDFCRELGLRYSQLSGLLTYFDDWLYHESSSWGYSVFYNGKKLGDFELGLEGFQELYMELKSKSV